MNRREELNALLESICPNVYFQPPETVKMRYPCIVYGRTSINPQYADNEPYLLHVGYSMRYITKDPDDPVIFQLARLPKCRKGSQIRKDNLYQEAYTIYY